MGGRDTAIEWALNIIDTYNETSVKQPQMMVFLQHLGTNLTLICCILNQQSDKFDIGLSDSNLIPTHIVKRN